jgi:Skp family chaperone for outer membrane proteins
MKRTLFIAAAFALLIGAPLLCSSQTRPAPTGPATQKPATPPAAVSVPETKIALIDTNVFSDEQAGIKRYLSAVKNVRSEFQPKETELLSLQTRIKTIADEINKLTGTPVVSAENVRAKQDEGERLQREFKYKKEQVEVDFQKRYEVVVGPISADIGKAIDRYAVEHGLTMILDVSKLVPAVLTMNPAMNVTQAFITEYNSRNP